MIFSRIYIGSAFLFFLLPLSFASAHIPLVVSQATMHDITEIKNPEYSQAFYGVLDDKPDTYEIRSTTPFLLNVEILLPEMDGVSRTIAGIVIKESGRQGQVNEVARLLGKDSAWESFYEPWGGDRYLKGGMFSKEVEPGVYRIEVSTPDNHSPYVLVVGTEEEWGEVGYFEMLGRIADVKVFYGKSKFMLIQSPLAYIPLAVVLTIGLVYFLYRRKQRGSIVKSA